VSEATFNIVLVAPEIPPNTGNVIRLASNSGCRLHLVKPLGFDLSDKQLRRAGLDYHEFAALKVHADFAALLANERPPPDRMFALTTHARRRYSEVVFAPGDWFVFGCETRGLDRSLRESFGVQRQLRLPMRPGNRSMNLSNAVAVVVYEAWRQTGFRDGV
jgi:tRNA (cytidine/uridine-2'-O-)-methyltransferase